MTVGGPLPEAMIFPPPILRLVGDGDAFYCVVRTAPPLGPPAIYYYYYCY